jgi:hypothetical protein
MSRPKRVKWSHAGGLLSGEATKNGDWLTFCSVGFPTRVTRAAIIGNRLSSSRKAASLRGNAWRPQGVAAPWGQASRGPACQSRRD